MSNLKEIYNLIVDDKCQEINWNDYEFGKNFYNNVQRNQDDTDIETDFIINKLRLKPGANILDLGCGDGRNSFKLAEKNYKITGVDLNLYAINQGLEKINDNKQDNITLIHNNILNIEFNENFDAVIVVFNHFSNFKIGDAQKLLNKIEKSLVKDGKFLIEISSESFLENLDNTQEWHFLDNWLSGEYEQMVLIENKYNEKEKAHIRKDHCIGYDLSYKGYIQKSYSYTPEKIHEMLKKANLKLVQIYGDWEGKMYDSGDDFMIITGQK